MQPDQKDQPEATRWALPASVATHLAVVALLVFGLPRFDFSQPQEQAVDVQLVPPPKPPEPVKPPPPAPKPATKPAPEPKPEPKKAEAVPPPPPPTPAPAPQPAVMQPVVEFGQKDSGPRKSPEGDSAEDAPAKPDTQAAEEKPAEPKLEPAKDDPSGGPRVAIVKPAEADKPKASNGRVKASTPKLAKATTLFSQAMTDDPVARTAIGKIPRDRRGGTLCGTELREQLVRGSPSYIPDLLPSVRLTKGTVIDVKAAFHAEGLWRAVTFRCEVDADAMKVVSFALDVGDLIPRSDWKRLGLPSQ